jgi:intein/homing endonuclease
MKKLINKNFAFLVDSYKNGYRGVVLEGGSRCFDGKQKIITEKGSKCISEIKIGDLVLSYNHKKNKSEYKKVANCIPQKNTKRCFKIKLKDGTLIECTEDHKFFYNGRYIELKNILSL